MKFNDLADLELIKDVFTETDLGPEVGEDKDIDIICRDCGKTFVFTAGEQEFYKSKNFAFPKRCKKCSKKRRLKFLKFR